MQSYESPIVIFVALITFFLLFREKRIASMRYSQSAMFLGDADSEDIAVRGKLTLTADSETWKKILCFEV